LTLAVRPPGATPLTTLLVTDIQNSTNLWEQLPTAVMNETLRLHHRCLRGLLPKCNGYESATEGDSFILAFHTPMDAARFALLAQQALLELPWPAELLEHEDGREVWAEPAKPKLPARQPPLGAPRGPGGGTSMHVSMPGGPMAAAAPHYPATADGDSEEEDAATFVCDSPLVGSFGNHGWLSVALQGLQGKPPGARRGGVGGVGGGGHHWRGASSSRKSLNLSRSSTCDRVASGTGVASAGGSGELRAASPLPAAMRAPTAPLAFGIGTRAAARLPEAARKGSHEYGSPFCSLSVSPSVPRFLSDAPLSELPEGELPSPTFRPDGDTGPGLLSTAANSPGTRARAPAPGCPKLQLGALAPRSGTPAGDVESAGLELSLLAPPRRAAAPRASSSWDALCEAAAGSAYYPPRGSGTGGQQASVDRASRATVGSD
ncbi:hypothetical protein Agub_g12279, partial [Astrephomene gubernaculifera]